MPEELSRSSAAYWRKQIDLAEHVRKQHEPWWEANLKAYSPDSGTKPDQYGSEINTNRDFTLVERKKADLFFQRPDVTMLPTPISEGPVIDESGQTVQGPPGPPDPNTGLPTPGQPISASVALSIHSKIVNEKLGLDGIDAVGLAHKSIFDVLVIGTGFTKMGYEAVIAPVQQPHPLTGEPVAVPVPVKEKCYWEHFSPKQALVPHNFRSTDWDKAPWLGYRFALPLTAASREKYQLPEDFTGKTSNDDQHFDSGADTKEAGDEVFTGVELWARSILLRDDVLDPDHLTHMVLIDGLEDFAIQEDCPEQELGENGVLTPKSLVGFPIHPLTIRTKTDSAWPPADCTLTRPLINELNISRSQNVQFRDAATMKWMYNQDVLPADKVAQIVRSPIGGMIGVPGEAFTPDSIKELPHGSMPRENFSVQDYIDNDISRSWAMDSGQQGVNTQGSASTATEQQIIQQNANARLDWERGRVLQWYVRGVTKFSTLILRYLPVQQAAQIVGPQAAQIWDTWRNTGVDSRLAFTAQPDSALRVDQAVDRKASQELYSFLANDPFVNRGKLLEKLLRKFHIDPTEIVKQPEPPKPEPPKLAFSLKGEDLVAPQAPIVLEILQQQGIQISEAAIALSQQALATLQQMQAAQAAEQKGSEKHGGKVAPQESLSKHASDQTGGMQNTGAPAPMGGGGGNF